MKIVRVHTGADAIVCRDQEVVFVDPHLSYAEVVTKVWHLMPNTRSAEIHHWALDAAPPFAQERARLSSDVPSAWGRGRRKVAAVLASVVAVLGTALVPTAAYADSPIKKPVYIMSTESPRLPETVSGASARKRVD